MKTDLIHTPEGVRDIYGEEYEKKLRIQEFLHQRLQLFGYRDIQTPTFEFFEVFGKEIGTTPAKDLFKFFDPEGNTLCLRPDFTPSIARCAVKYFSGEKGPLRLTYQGSAFSNTSLLQGKLKETTQLGAELMGEPSVEADGEIIGMLADALQSVGLTEFQVSIGEADFFRGLSRGLGLSREEEETVRAYISNKNFFAVEEYLSAAGKQASVIHTLLQIEELFGSVEVLEQAGRLAGHPLAREAISRLQSLYEVLRIYGVEPYVSFDLGLLSSYHYYTGIMFKAYTRGIGDVIAKGGRYDRLLFHFGRDLPAVGFVIVVDDLMQALFRQGIEIPLPAKRVTLRYEKDRFCETLKQARKLREEGCFVELLPG